MSRQAVRRQGEAAAHEKNGWSRRADRLRNGGDSAAAAARAALSGSRGADLSPETIIHLDDWVGVIVSILKCWSKSGAPRLVAPAAARSGLGWVFLGRRAAGGRDLLPSRSRSSRRSHSSFVLMLPPWQLIQFSLLCERPQRNRKKETWLQVARSSVSQEVLTASLLEDVLAQPGLCSLPYTLLPRRGSLTHGLVVAPPSLRCSPQ